MKNFIAVGIGGFIGTLLRYVVSQVLLENAFPYGTLIANWTGCFGLAWLNEQCKYPLSPVWRKGLGTGMIGAYTTFSTFCVEAHLLSPLVALFYIIATVSGGLLFARLGTLLAQGGEITAKERW